LARLYQDTVRLKEAETAYRESLDIYRSLASENPSVYSPDLKSVLGNFAALLKDQERFDELNKINVEVASIH
jgi:hypothetical protein